MPIVYSSVTGHVHYDGKSQRDMMRNPVNDYDDNWNQWKKTGETLDDLKKEAEEAETVLSSLIESAARIVKCVHTVDTFYNSGRRLRRDSAA